MHLRWQPFDHPWVIAHRGASGLLPEHTLPGYALAIEQGADVIEPDLVLSADGVLHARHDLGLARSTNVAAHPQFAARRRRDGDHEDWWIADFSADELRALRAIQPHAKRPSERDGEFAIPSFASVLQLLEQERRRRDKPLVVYPELKHPSYFAERGLSMLRALSADLARHGWTGSSAPVWIQCFELPTLLAVKRELGLRTTLLSLQLPEICADVDGYGISKSALMSSDGATFIAAAHRSGQVVHAWTFRDDDVGADPYTEAMAAFAAGCDGLFGDFPATLLRARRHWSGL